MEKDDLKSAHQGARQIAELVAGRKSGDRLAYIRGIRLVNLKIEALGALQTGDDS